MEFLYELLHTLKSTQPIKWLGVYDVFAPKYHKLGNTKLTMFLKILFRLALSLSNRKIALI